MHHPTYRITHTTAFVTPVVEQWLERDIAQLLSTESMFHYPAHRLSCYNGWDSLPFQTLPWLHSCVYRRITGSRDHGITASAVISMRLPHSASVFTAETWAISKALEEIKNNASSSKYFFFLQTHFRVSKLYDYGPMKLEHSFIGMVIRKCFFNFYFANKFRFHSTLVSFFKQSEFYYTF